MDRSRKLVLLAQTPLYILRYSDLVDMSSRHRVYTITSASLRDWIAEVQQHFAPRLWYHKRSLTRCVTSLVQAQAEINMGRAGKTLVTKHLLEHAHDAFLAYGAPARVRADGTLVAEPTKDGFLLSSNSPQCLIR
jgi:hypothetical protein